MFLLPLGRDDLTCFKDVFLPYIEKGQIQVIYQFLHTYAA